MVNSPGGNEPMERGQMSGTRAAAAVFVGLQALVAALAVWVQFGVKASGTNFQYTWAGILTPALLVLCHCCTLC